MKPGNVEINGTYDTSTYTSSCRYLNAKPVYTNMCYKKERIFNVNG